MMLFITFEPAFNEIHLHILMSQIKAIQSGCQYKQAVFRKSKENQEFSLNALLNLKFVIDFQNES